jgi:uncharacterized protein Yka (UPF0111/DUF47 family)
MEQAQALGGVVRDSARTMRRALDAFKQGDDVEQEAVQIRELEHEGDRIYRQAVASLFDGGIDPMLVIRWKDIVERLEQAVDSCDHVGHVLEGIVVTQA